MIKSRYDEEDVKMSSVSVLLSFDWQQDMQGRGQSATDCVTVDRNPFSLAGTMSNYSEGMPAKGHLDRSLTSGHHASSGTDSLLPKTNAYKPTEIKSLSIIVGPELIV